MLSEMMKIVRSIREEREQSVLYYRKEKCLLNLIKGLRCADLLLTMTLD